MAMDTVIYKVNEKMEFLVNDKEALWLYHLHEIVQLDHNSSMRKAEAEGKAEEKIEIAHNMKVSGEPVEKFVEYTGLAVNVIEDL